MVVRSTKSSSSKNAFLDVGKDEIKDFSCAKSVISENLGKVFSNAKIVAQQSISGKFSRSIFKTILFVLRCRSAFSTISLIRSLKTAFLQIDSTKKYSNFKYRWQKTLLTLRAWATKGFFLGEATSRSFLNFSKGCQKWWNWIFTTLKTKKTTIISWKFQNPSGAEATLPPLSDVHDYVIDLLQICSRLRAFVHKRRLLIILGITIFECKERFTVFINEYRSCNHRWTCIEKNKYNMTIGDRCCLKKPLKAWNFTL